MEGVETEYNELASINKALEEAPPPVAFLQLELPGKSPGIVAEPRETWFVGDY